MFIVPCHHPQHSLSPTFVLPTIRPPCCSLVWLFVGVAVRWCGCSLVWLYLRFVFPAFVILSICRPLFVATIVFSASNSPYEQWLVGGLVVLCDVAAAAAAEFAVGGVELLLLAIAIAV
jgi:hypothetical protein